MEPNKLARWCQSFMWQEAATLAIIRQGKYDIRPELLLLFHAGDGGQFPKVHRHGACYLRAWSERHGGNVRAEILDAAAGDALAVMWHRRAPAPVSARAREFHIRNSVFFELRTVAMQMYQSRLHEARVRFLSGTIYTHGSVSSKIGNASPGKSSRAGPGNAQQLEFKWAA